MDGRQFYDAGFPSEFQQSGPVYEGPGADKDKCLLRLPKLSRYQYDAVQKAKKYAAEQGIKMALLKQTIVQQQQQMQNAHSSVQKQQAFALMCRIYVGSINFEIKEDMVKQAFLPFGPIKSISMPYDNVIKKHKGFAFIEYDIPEAASLAVEQMNGVLISGYSIKVGRPSNMPQAQPLINQIMEDAKSYNRIYVGSVHEDLKEEDVKSVFGAFGNILSCKLATDPMKSSKHRGYCYIDYETSQNCNDAVAAMNLFDLGGMYLRVGRAVAPPNVMQMFITPGAMPTASAIAAAAITAKIQALEAVSEPESVSYGGRSSSGSTAQSSGYGSSAGSNASLSLQPHYHDHSAGGDSSTRHNSSWSPEAEQNSRHSSTRKNYDSGDRRDSRDDRHGNGAALKESCLMVLDNMVEADEVDEDLEEEVRDECNNYGSVTNIHVSMVQRYNSHLRMEETAVRIFVQFSSPGAVLLAVQALNGRFFAGKSIEAKPYDQELFDRRDYNA